MKTLFCLLLSAVVFIRCNTPANDIHRFVAGEYAVDESVFPEEIRLTGEPVVLQDSCKILFRRPQLALKDSILVVLNEKDPTPIHLYKLPDFTYIGAFGGLGRGPEEFLYPNLVALKGEGIVCGIFEQTAGTMHQLTASLKLQKIKTGSLENQFNFSAREILYLHQGRLAFVTAAEQSKKIISTDLAGNSQQSLYNLALDSTLKSPYPWSGIAAANLDKDRMVYAYNYFKVLKFMTLDAGTVKTLNFNRPGFDMKTLLVPDGLDLNHLYYWGSLSGQEDYVYVETVNKSADQLREDKMNHVHATVIEQYTWDGKPVRRIVLDKEGRFVVDEPNGVIYLLSEYDDSPFFMYRLPLAR